MSNKIKNILLAPFRFFLFIFDRALAAAGAVAFAQFPSFIVQYQQRLGGHVDELGFIVSKYTEAAAKNNRTIEEYISIHLKSEINDFVSSGKIMAENLSRHTELGEALRALMESSGIMKPFVFLKTMNFDILKKTADNFTPGISFNIDTLFYALAGIIVTMGIYYMIKKSLSLIKNSITNKSKK